MKGLLEKSDDNVRIKIAPELKYDLHTVLMGLLFSHYWAQKRRAIASTGLEIGVSHM